MTTAAQQLETMVDDLIEMQETLKAIGLTLDAPSELGLMAQLAAHHLGSAEQMVFAAYCTAARACTSNRSLNSKRTAA
jgi:hypothetical protein